MTFENVLAECAFNDSMTRADALKNFRPKLPCHVAGREQYRSALRSRHVSPQQFGRRVEAVSIRGAFLEDTVGHESAQETTQALSIGARGEGQPVSRHRSAGE